MTEEERQQKLEALRERVAALSPEQVLKNLIDSLTHCWVCQAYVDLDAPVCESCGNELMEYGKN